MLGKSRGEPRTATQFNQLSPQSRNFNSPQSGAAVSILNSQSNQYNLGTTSNSPMTARFSATTGGDQISPATYSNRGDNYGISSTTLSASRGNLAANSTVPISSLQTPGGYGGFDEKGLIGGRQSYSTNQMSSSVTGSVGISNSLGGPLNTLSSGVGVGGASGMASSSQYSSSMQGASYGPGRAAQSGTYYQQTTTSENEGSVTTSRQ